MPGKSLRLRGSATALQMGRRGTACVHAMMDEDEQQHGRKVSQHGSKKAAAERQELCHELLILGPTLRRLLKDQLPDTRCSYRVTHRDDADEKAAKYHALMIQGVFETQGALVVPLFTTGDGSCLLHALSRAIWGVEIFSDVLRMDICAELENNRDWYVERVGEEEVGAAQAQAMARNAWLSNLHAVAAAHVLRRPVIIYASLEEQQALGCGFYGVAGVFMPARLPPSECYPHPVTVGWQSTEKNHYVAMVASGDDQLVWPVPENEVIEDASDDGEDVADPFGLPVTGPSSPYLDAQCSSVQPNFITKLLDQVRSCHQQLMDHHEAGLDPHAFDFSTLNHIKAQCVEDAQVERGSVGVAAPASTSTLQVSVVVGEVEVALAFGEKDVAFVTALNAVQDGLFGEESQSSEIVFKIAQQLDEARKEGRMTAKDQARAAVERAAAGGGGKEKNRSLAALLKGHAHAAPPGAKGHRLLGAVSAVIRARHELHALEEHPIRGIRIHTLDSAGMHWVCAMHACVGVPPVRVHVVFPATYPHHPPEGWYRLPRVHAKDPSPRKARVSSAAARVRELDAEEVLGAPWHPMHSSAGELLGEIFKQLREQLEDVLEEQEHQSHGMRKSQLTSSGFL